MKVWVTRNVLSYGMQHLDVEPIGQAVAEARRQRQSEIERLRALDWTEEEPQT